MLTYQLQKRGFVLLGGPPFSFPNDVVIEMHLGPPQPFGAANGGYTFTAAGSFTATLNPSLGRTWLESTPALERVVTEMSLDKTKVKLNGNRLSIATHCNCQADLVRHISSFYYLLPIVLNVKFADPPVVLKIFGAIGESKFEWGIRAWEHPITVTTPDEQARHFIDAVESMPLFYGESNRRVAAALNYFHVACRLNAAGTTPWEFMAEMILNLTKTLQVLFGEDRDDVRAGLQQFYTDEDIEQFFIPVMILRASFDSGHVTLAMYEEKDLDAIYRFLGKVVGKVRELLQGVFDAARSNTLQLPAVVDLLPDNDQKKTIAKIAKNWSKPQ